MAGHIETIQDRQYVMKESVGLGWQCEGVCTLYLPHPQNTVWMGWMEGKLLSF